MTTWRFEQADKPAPPPAKLPPWESPLQATSDRTDHAEPADRLDAATADAEAARERMLAYRRDAAKEPLSR